MDARALFARGRELLDPLLFRHGFEFDVVHWQRGSSATFARVRYGRGDRAMELGVGRRLDQVVYQVDDLVLTHDAYMRAVLGPAGSNMYPAMTGDPMDGFRYLANDLSRYGNVFLCGPLEHFRQIVERSHTLTADDARTTMYRR